MWSSRRRRRRGLLYSYVARKEVRMNATRLTRWNRRRGVSAAQFSPGVPSAWLALRCRSATLCTIEAGAGTQHGSRSHQHQHEGCDDGSFFSTGGVCASDGTCTSGEYTNDACPEVDTNPCTHRSCNTDDGSCDVQPTLDTCNDGNDCTVFDACFNFACACEDDGH